MRTCKDVRKKDIVLIDVMERLEILEVERVGIGRSERNDFTHENLTL